MGRTKKKHRGDNFTESSLIKRVADRGRRHALTTKQINQIHSIRRTKKLKFLTELEVKKIVALKPYYY